MIVDVEPNEYNRLLGYPRGWELSGRARELAAWARAWYAENGRPWVHVRHAERLEINDRSICIEGATFTSARLQKTFQDADAHGAVLAALSAGPEVEEQTSKLWSEEKPDEYFFLEMFGSAVVERLTTMTGARLCDWGEGRGIAVLPHYSPGYPEWDISEQPRLFHLIKPHAVPCPVEVLDSGALRPKKSLLAVFGLAPQTERLRRLTDLVPCNNCSLSSCVYRRAPKYEVNARALKRWAAERLSIEPQKDRSINARFRYDGTTCTNMGRPLVFQYDVKLGPRDEGYPIREQRCSPVPGDDGYTYMCQYLKDPVPLMTAIRTEKPLLGQPLNNILSWQRSSSAAGCYCDAASREHKWGLVLETIHYALMQGGQ